MTDAVQHHHCNVPLWRRPPVLVLGVVVVALAIFAIVEAAGIPAATAYGTFLDQLDAGNVASVTLQGTEIKGHFKHPLNAAAANDTAQANTFRTRVPDFGDSSLIAALRKQRVMIDVASSTSWTRLLAGIPLPMWLFLGFIIIAGIVRLMRGGKAQSGSTAMPMHPMQGMIGLVSGLFGKQSQATNTPTQDGDGTKNG
jgi:ATP-dependent Zn protease